MTKYPQKVIMKIYHQKYIYKWVGLQLANEKAIKLTSKKSNINVNKQNGNKCKDIKNNKKTYKTSLLTSMNNKKNEMRKYKSNAPQLKQSQLIH
jgi:hypothetical protein